MRSQQLQDRWARVFVAWTAIVVGFALSMTTVTSAQEATTPVVEVVAEEAVVDGRAEFIAFEKDSDVKEGLRILAALYDKNIVPSPKVDGMLGFTKLRDVTFDEAMDAEQGGATYVDREVVVDGNLVTARTWHDNSPLLREFVKMLGSRNRNPS